MDRTAPVAVGLVEVTCAGDGTEEGWCGTSMQIRLEILPDRTLTNKRTPCTKCGRTIFVGLAAITLKD